MFKQAPSPGETQCSGKRADAAIGRVSGEYKDRQVAQGAACSAEWAVSMAVRRRQELMDTSARFPVVC